MNTDMCVPREDRFELAGVPDNRQARKRTLILPIPDTCAGGTRGGEAGCIECLGSPFHCEYLTEIDDRCFCHHPRSAEIAARTLAAKGRAVRRGPVGPVSEMRRCLMKILGRPPQ